MSKTKPELTWIGKDKRPKLEPCAADSKCCHASHKNLDAYLLGVDYE